MPLKTKVKFTDAQSLKKSGGGTTAPNSPNNSDNVPLQSGATLRDKSRKSKKGSKATELLASSSEVNDGDYQLNEDGTMSGMQDGSGRQGRRSSFKSNSLREIGSLVLMDCDKNVSDGSIEDEEVPEVQWPPSLEGGAGGKGGVCPVGGGGVGGGGGVEANDGANEAATSCNVGVRLTVSEKITPCMKSDEQPFSTTDYNKMKEVSADLGRLPNLIHPLNGQVSTFARHREFTNYLRTSGVLRLYGTCILSVYRMKTWPAPEKLMEQILNAMGYRMTTRTEVEELTELKNSLIDRLKDLIKERCELLEKLDDFQDSGAKYQLLDQDEILPPRPENSKLNIELMTETFKQFEEDASPSSSSTSPPAGNGEEDSAELKVTLSKKAPLSDTLPIPEHDTRMLI